VFDFGIFELVEIYLSLLYFFSDLSIFAGIKGMLFCVVCMCEGLGVECVEDFGEIG